MIARKGNEGCEVSAGALERGPGGMGARPDLLK